MEICSKKNTVGVGAEETGAKEEITLGASVEVNDGLAVVGATLLGWRVDGASVEVNDGLAVVGAATLGWRVDGAQWK